MNNTGPRIAKLYPQAKPYLTLDETLADFPLTDTKQINTKQINTKQTN